MKNYIHDIISRYIKHDYPKEVDQDFRAWLTDEEHTNEKEQTLNELWENTESVTTPDYQHSLERMHELTGIGTRQRIRTLHTRLVAWRVVAALLIAVSWLPSIWLCRTGRHRTYCRLISLLPRQGILLCRMARR